MSTTSSVLSQTLQSITNIKLRELETKKGFFHTRKAHILANVQQAVDDRSKIEALILGLAKIGGLKTQQTLDDLEDTDLAPLLAGTSFQSFHNIKQFLQQSRYDPSLPPSLLPNMEKDLKCLLDQRAEKFEYASLYSRLLTEWLKSDAMNATDSALDNSSLEEDNGFEFVERQKERLKQLSEKFESVVFTPLNVDAAAIKDLLNGLFITEEAETLLSQLRKRICTFGQRLSAQTSPFDLDVLRWCIKGLLKSDLLSDAKKNTLEGFLKDEVVLTEIADVLNMRFVDLETWTWDADEGIPVEPRRQLNGKYRVIMDEDILQSVFLHYIGTLWAVEFKSALGSVVRKTNVWQQTETMPLSHLNKLNYYFSNSFTGAGVTYTRQSTYEDDFFMCQLPSSVDDGMESSYDQEVDVNKQHSGRGNIKQQLLRTLGTEVFINRSLNAQVAVVQSDLQWFATSTSHATVDAILTFFAVPTIWRSFFQRYLAAPLRMVGLEGEQGAVRVRKRGVPINHVFQKLFGELIVFSMDMAVNQEAGMLLYRLHDDLWLCGEPQRCAKAWKAIERCARIMGVEFNRSKTGSVYITQNGIEKDAQVAATLPTGRVIIGFLELQPETGNWAIDHKAVDAHVSQLRKQLIECNSVFAWVQTWNSCIGRFFNFTFGQPANCFGSEHVDLILETHRRIQQDLFGIDTGDGGSYVTSVTKHLKSIISKRFNVSNIPDAFLYLPEEMGGLGLKNPFIPFLMARSVVLASPTDRMNAFFEAEARTYKRAKKDFETLTEREKAKRLEHILGRERDRARRAGEVTNPNTAMWKGPSDNAFLPFEDFIAYRLTSSTDLWAAYTDLIEELHGNEIEPSSRTLGALYPLAQSQPEVAWKRMGADRQWLVELYAKEMSQRFGGLALVDKTLLPMGVMKVVKSRKVAWQGVL